MDKKTKQLTEELWRYAVDVVEDLERYDDNRTLRRDPALRYAVSQFGKLFDAARALKNELARVLDKPSYWEDAED